MAFQLSRCLHGIALIIGISVLFATSVFAQTGKISGKVVDQQTRQVLPGVNVVLSGTSLGAATDDEGDFYIINIPPGTYSVQATMIGFATQTQTGILVQLDRTIVVNFDMGTEAVQGEAVTITAERELIQMDLAGTATLMQAEEFTTAPITQVADYLIIQEGVTYESTARGKFLSIRGGDADETDFVVDGQSTMNPITNVAYMGVSKTAIREVQLQAGGFNAEYGQVRSGLVNVVTRDGSREEYFFALDSKYSRAALKHFGRNLFDRDSPTYVTRTGRNNFQPGDFNGSSFTPQGDTRNWGLRGEVTLDANSPEYRGYRYDKETDTYTDNAGVAYTAAEQQTFGMEPVFGYPSTFQWEGYKSMADATQGGVPTDDMNPADLLGEWNWVHQGHAGQRLRGNQTASCRRG